MPKFMQGFNVGNKRFRDISCLQLITGVLSFASTVLYWGFRARFVSFYVQSDFVLHFPLLYHLFLITDPNLMPFDQSKTDCMVDYKVLNAVFNSISVISRRPVCLSMLS